MYSYEAPRYRTATNAMVASYSIKTVAHLLLGGECKFARKIKSVLTGTAYMFLDNKRRDKNNGPVDENRGAEAGMLDVTEFENPDFRYVL